MTKSLTEQWKDETLPVGPYYWKKEKDMWVANVDEMQDYLELYDNRNIQVLAPVPSYEEYQGLLSDNLALDEAKEINAELEYKVKKLEQQLAEANEVIKEYADSSNWEDYYNEYSDSIVDDCIFYDSVGWAVAKDYLKKWGVK